MLIHRKTVLAQNSSQRKGVAAVECALVAPLLVLITMGAIDSGQFVNMAQVVNDASYAGARQASQNTALNQSEVRATVLNYVAQQCPHISATQLDSAITVNVYRSLNVSLLGGDLTAVLNGDLTTILSGEPVAVQVIFRYDSVRWLNGFPGLGGRSLETTTFMRRE
ncbi:TadE/TadG family type IV pilus assembly protein [Gimesia panareensis]|uniref:TadE-like protein n=1 Tax=Gimesia panareensis TaxID=2527978 RepID=A0A517Q9Z3_9PLAN|nr:TadE/TadG family type IV pilus assembly protein [Gimesia panareensis]QDT28452.1 TadE-like protein [Gimesia panareensis]QDU51312.1 TadE-like protein [Gimesia panareensis]